MEWDPTLKVNLYATIVCLAIHTETLERVVVKMIHLKTTCPSDIEKEVKLMKRMRHPNIVPLYHCIATLDHVLLFMQRAQGGDLANYIVSRKGIDEHECKFIMYQLLLALQNIHRLRICHRGIKKTKE